MAEEKKPIEVRNGRKFIIEAIIEEGEKEGYFFIRLGSHPIKTQAIEFNGTRLEVKKEIDFYKLVRLADGYYVKLADNSLIQTIEYRRTHAEGGNMLNENIGGGDGEPG